MARKEFNNENLADVGKISEANMLEISFDNCLFDSIGKIEEVNPSELTLLDANPMNMDQDENWKALLYSIQETGVWKENPIVVEKRDDGTKVVLAGNRRTLISRQLKLDKVPIVYKTFESDAERRRFIDSSNTHRDPKLIDILNRYELNAKLYDEGYWKDSPIGKLKKIDAVAAIIGYPVSKLHNIRFLLEIKNDFEKIINLIDEGVIVVNDIRKLCLLDNKGKVDNYETVLKKLCEDEVVNNNDIKKSIRKKAAKEIIESIEIRRNRKDGFKKAHVEIKKIEKRINLTFPDRVVHPNTQKQREEIDVAIDNIVNILKRYKGIYRDKKEEP